MVDKPAGVGPYALDALDAPARVRALAETGLLDAPADAAFDRLTTLAAALLDVPIALVTLVDSRRQFFASARGLPEPWATRRETPLSHSLCQHVVRSGAPVVIADARRHPLGCDNLAVPELGIVSYLGHPLTTAGGVVLGSFAVADAQTREWTEREVRGVGEFAALAAREVALGRAARATAALLEHASEACLALDHEWRVTSCNAAAEAALGAPRAALLGRVAWAALPAAAAQALEPIARRAAAEQRPVESEAELLELAGAGPCWLEVRGVPGRDGVAVLARDVTARVLAERALRESEARFRHQALHDPLTGLANRTLLGDRVAHALERAARDGTVAALLYLDLDGFKQLNDTLGHAAGDAALVAAAERLRAAVRTGDTVARLGGDEFAVLLEGTHPAQAEAEAVEIAARVVATLRAPVALDGHAPRLGASVGIATARAAASPDALLRRADRAMYQAKARGGGQYVVASRAGEWTPERAPRARAD